MKRATTETLVIVLLVSAGAGSRVLFREVPNFAPIAAIALFAGYYFRRSSVATLTPLLALLVSDCWLGFYEWPIMAVVYATLTLPVALRPLAQKFLTIEQRSPVRTAASLCGLLTCSAGSSLVFFLATNLAVWYGSSWYPQTGEGLIACYVAALPFFKYTLLGDIFYASLLFGGYAAAVKLSGAGREGRALSPAT